MAQLTVRVIRTWDVNVEAEYGDDTEALKAKVTEQYLDDTAPDAETRVILEHHESEFDTYEEYVASLPTAVEGG